MLRIHNAEKGLTLVELMVTMALVSAILGAIWAVYNVGATAYNNQLTRSGVKGETAWAFARMTNELRMANSITAATASSLTFTADLDSNGANETIQYAWSGTSLTPLNRVQTVPSPTVTTPLIHSITSLAFSYYGANSTTPLNFPVTPSQVKLVGIDATASSGSETFHLRTNIYLREI